MAITHEDVQELKKVFDDRYVQISDCDNVQSSFNKKFANDDKRIDLLISQQKINNWLTLAIAGGIISLVIKVFLGG
jgi:hypothetical protein